MDAELNDFDDRAVFYSDDGTSFRNIMFMGKVAPYKARMVTSRRQGWLQVGGTDGYE